MLRFKILSLDQFTIVPSSKVNNVFFFYRENIFESLIYLIYVICLFNLPLDLDDSFVYLIPCVFSISFYLLVEQVFYFELRSFNFVRILLTKI